MTVSAGADLLRKEDRSLLTGRGVFVDDVHVNRMAHGVFVRSPFPHARIKAIYTNAARKAGALAVLTAQKIAIHRKTSRRALLASQHPQGAAEPVGS